MQSPSLEEVRTNRRFLEALPLLISSLREELVKIEALHACLVREKEILHGGSPEALLESNREKEQILTELETTRSLRSPVLMELSDLSGIPSDQISVKVLAALASGPARRELMTLRQGLSLLAGKIRALNERNRGLIENSRQYVRSWLTFLMNAASSTPCYAKSGVVPPSELKGRFFRTEG
ncbi:MAG: flagellar protein FlgN [Syntrophales bacterium]